MDIGFIGLGNMGYPMARRLGEAGHKLIVYDTSGQMMSRLTSLGAVAAKSPRDVADQVETVMASLPTPDIVLALATGMGRTMKLCNNLLWAANMALSSEMMVMGAKAGLDPQIMVDVINVSSGLNTAIRDKFPKSVMPGTFDYGFYTGLMYKDVRLCVEEGEAMGVPMPLAGAVHQMWLMANAVNGPGSDFTEITKIIEKWAGVEVRAKKK